MTYDQIMKHFTPGSVARRVTWDRYYTLQRLPGDVVRLRDSRDPGFGPAWRQSGYDANATDYFFEATPHARPFMKDTRRYLSLETDHGRVES